MFNVPGRAQQSDVNIGLPDSNLRESKMILIKLNVARDNMNSSNLTFSGSIQLDPRGIPQISDPTIHFTNCKLIFLLDSIHIKLSLYLPNWSLQDVDSASVSISGRKKCSSYFHTSCTISVSPKQTINRSTSQACLESPSRRFPLRYVPLYANKELEWRLQQYRAPINYWILPA